MRRIKLRGNLDRFERENVDFYSRVRDVYLSRAAAEPSRYFVINAEQPVHDIQRDLQTIADQLILAHLPLHPDCFSHSGRCHNQAFFTLFLGLVGRDS